MYICKRCGYETSRKLNFKRHINRKNPCEEKIQQPVFEESEEESDHDEYRQKPPNSAKIEKITAKNRQIPPNSAKKFECEYCEKQFTRNDSLNKHLKNRCKIKKEYEESELRLKEKELEFEKDLRIDMEKKYEEQLKIQREQTEKIVDKLLSRVGDVHNTVNVSNTNNIILNDFGKESIEHLTSKVLEWCSFIPSQRIPQITDFIHFHEKAPPENKNLRIENKNKPIISVIENGDWVYKEKDDVIDVLMDRNIDLMDEYYDENEEDINDFSKERFDNYKKNDDRIKKSKKQIELSILSKSNKSQ